MPEAQLSKNHFRFNRGLNTEANEISFPDGYSTDERNYELLVDGSRRRRKGLARESGGAAYATGQTISATQVQHSAKWRGVAGDPDKHFIVHQIGNELFFSDDAETISTTYHTDQIDLTAYIVSSSTTDAQVADNPCQFSFGRGHLFVTHKYLKPFYVSYDSAGDSFAANIIQILIRDFDGIDDGVGVDTEPTGTITADHRYNLRNRGWKEDDMASYLSDQVKHPAKNALWFRGYRRQTNVTYADADGIQAWDSAKLDAEAFGNATAPQGSLFLDPLNTTFAVSVSGGGLSVPITASGSFQTGSATAGGSFRLTVPSHGRSSGDSFLITGSSWLYNKLGGSPDYEFTYDGEYTLIADDTEPTVAGAASVVTADSNTIDIYIPPIDANFGSFATTDPDGYIAGGDVLTKSDGTELSVGPSVVAFHAGRVFLMGIDDAKYADTVFFSKVALEANAYGKCHQEQDPTDPEYNQLTPADGGTIVIPNLGKVKRALSLRGNLLIFSTQGVWEIGGGSRGFFTADGYSVRKISEAECSSPFSPIQFDNGAIFTGPKGIYQVSPNQFTSLLEASNISENLVQTLWNSIPAANQQVVQTCYDDALKRVYLLYGDTGDNINQYANALVLDLRVGAFYKYTFNVSSTAGILTAFSITDADSSASNQKVKWQVQSTNSIDTCDLNQTAYLDYDGAESPLPYVVSGWDNLGDFQFRKQAPVITVFQKRTETGYPESGDPTNESSTLMQAYWDWTDDTVTGKVGAQQQVYRHVRAFAPSGASDEDGYPVVTTRNKVRGRGRVLQIRFDGEATKDSHILGFTTNYKIARPQ